MSKIREVQLSKRTLQPTKRKAIAQKKRKKGFLSHFFDYFLFFSLFD